MPDINPVTCTADKILREVMGIGPTTDMQDHLGDMFTDVTTLLSDLDETAGRDETEYQELVAEVEAFGDAFGDIIVRAGFTPPGQE